MSEHNFKTVRSSAYLERLSPAEQEEAKRQLTWDWTEEAKDLLTRYPRRTSLDHEPFLTLEELEQEFLQQWGEQFPAILDFQKELVGVTFPNHRDGNWLTLGIQFVAPPSDFDDGDMIRFNCADFDTARPDVYLINPAGEVVHHARLAQSWKTELERRAFYLNRASSPAEERAWVMVFRGMPLVLADVFSLMEKESRRLGWSLYRPGSDSYHRIYGDPSGYMSCQHNFDGEKSQFFRMTADNPEALQLVYGSLSKRLDVPPLLFESRTFTHEFNG